MSGQPISSRLRALTIACTDEGRSLHFYETILGAEVIGHEFGTCPWLRLGSIEISLAQSVEEPSPAQYGVHAMPMLWLEVDDLAAAAEWYAQSAVHILAPFTGDTSMTIADPDGIVIEVWSSQAIE